MLGLHCCVGFSLVVVSRGYSSLCVGFSLQWSFLWSTGSRVHCVWLLTAVVVLVKRGL